MEIFSEIDLMDRERYRNPPAPLGYQNLNPPDIVRRETDEIEINFQEWIDLGIFEDDMRFYEHFVLNSDSEDDDIVEVPFEPVVKDIESISLIDDDEDTLPIPVDNIKKEKEEIKTENKSKDVENTEKTDSNKVKEVKITEQRTEKKSLGKDEEIKRKEVKSTEQSIKERINKKPQDKVAEDVTAKRTDEYKDRTSEKIEKYREKKTKKDDEGNRHKKVKPKIELDGDKSSKKKSRTSSREDSEFEVAREVKSSKKKNRPVRDDDDSDFDIHLEREIYTENKKKKKKRPVRDVPVSDSDFESGEERYRRKEKKYRSPSPADDYYENDYNIKEEKYKNFKQEYDEDYYPAASIKQEYPFVHGVYHCDVCNLNLNSEVTYQSHITGKRHKKNMDAKNVAQAVAKSYVPTKPASKCPNPPPGFKRVEVSSPAKIQRFVDEKLQIPCPGLHKVTEIQGISETSYYCTLCDAPCSANSIIPHLSGFKHQLNILKHYDSSLFDKISYQQKYKIEGQVNSKLSSIERKYGRGRLRVEKDVPDNGAYDRGSIPSTSSFEDLSYNLPSTPSRSTSSSRNQPSTSKEGGDFLELYQSCSLPDPSKAGFYCRICHSHSNSKPMWEAHIRGKRHIANLKKAPGTAPSKSRNVPAPSGTIAKLYSLLEGVEDPIVGLDQIREIQRLDIDSVSYTCFLCGGISVCEGEIVDHILLTKHREKYLEKIDYPELETLRNCQMSDHALTSVIAEMCARVEDEQGRGEPEVYFAKNSLLKL